MPNTIISHTSVCSTDNQFTYYCPLHIIIYAPGAEAPIMQGSDCAALYQDEICSVIVKENTARGASLADYFWGNPTVAAKLTALNFSVCNLEGKLFGCFIADLTAPFSPVEDAEFRDWLTMQCTDGYGERLEQYSFETDEGTAYLSFRSAEGDCLILSAKELALA